MAWYCPEIRDDGSRCELLDTHEGDCKYGPPPINEPEVRNYLKKPIHVQALQLDNNNWAAAERWCNGWIVYTPAGAPHGVAIPTLEGVMTASCGDYIIKGVANEFYPCKSSIFEATYSEADQQIDF